MLLLSRSEDGSICVMDDDPKAPPPYLGVYPNGAYWSALPAESPYKEPKAHAVSGDVVRFMWDYGVSSHSGTGRGSFLTKPNGCARRSDSARTSSMRWARGATT